jgi:multisubunit Na+/H+ antiporter MnhG subunit
MANPLKTLVQDFGWIHTGVGLTGNVLFFVGSIAFLPRLGKVRLPWGAETEWQTVGVWLFIFGAFFMMVGSMGALLVKIYEARGQAGPQRQSRRRAHG